MKKLIIVSLLFSFFAMACNNTEQSRITYRSTDAISAYNLQYMTASGELEYLSYYPESAQDQWQFEYMADEGDIVYLSGNYKDLQSALKIMILIDGKVYKQASNQGDTLKYLTISGTVPYQE